MEIKIFDTKGKETRKETVLDTKKKPSEDLINIINRIINLSSLKAAHTKNRGERRGGGAKPWRQKGTGRARVGSNRSPIWRKGGITFGPRKDKNFKREINKKSAKIAKNYLLNEKLSNGEVIIWEIEPKTAPIKTKEAEKILLKLPVKEGRILLLIDEKECFPGFYNISYLDIKNVNSTSVLDPLKYKLIIFTRLGFKSINNEVRTHLVKGRAVVRKKDAKSKN